MNFVTDFTSSDDIISFLNVSKNTIEKRTDLSANVGIFDEYEVVYIMVESSLGTKLNMDTRTIDVYGKSTYIRWGNIKNLVGSFISDASPNSDSIFLDIRLRASSRMYNILNSNKIGEYSSFDLNFHINGDLYMVSTSSVEKSIPVIYPEISASWDTTIENYIYTWKQNKKKA